MNGPKLLRAWRDASELSQKAVAEALGLKQSTVAEWEAGNRRPEMHTALALEERSAGAVQIEAWDYDGGLIDAARRVITRRDDASALDVAPAPSLPAVAS